MLTLVVIVTFVASPARLPCACLFFSLPSRTRSCDAPRYPTPSCSQLCSRLLCVVRRSTSTRRGDLIFGIDASWVLFFLPGILTEYPRNTPGIQLPGILFCISVFLFCTRIGISFVFRHLEAYSGGVRRPDVACDKATANGIPTSNVGIQVRNTFIKDDDV